MFYALTLVTKQQYHLSFGNEKVIKYRKQFYNLCLFEFIWKYIQQITCRIHNFMIILW